MRLSKSGLSLILPWTALIAPCSAVPHSSLLSSSYILKYSPIQRRDVLPPYSNASSMPLYGLSRGPKRSDINEVVTQDGWFEAFATALTDVNSTVITDHLLDCGDGTVDVRVFEGSPKLEKTINVNKRGWGPNTSNNSVAWPAALFDGITKLSQIQNNSSNTMDQAITALYASFKSTSCSIAPSPAPNPYQMATKLPLIAYMRGNGTDASIAGRYLHVMVYNATSEKSGDFVSFDAASIPGAGSATKNLPLSEWDKDCLFLSMPPLSGI